MKRCPRTLVARCLKKNERRTRFDTRTRRTPEAQRPTAGTTTLERKYGIGIPHLRIRMSKAIHRCRCRWHVLGSAEKHQKIGLTQAFGVDVCRFFVVVLCCFSWLQKQRSESESANQWRRGSGREDMRNERFIASFACVDGGQTKQKGGEDASRPAINCAAQRWFVEVSS